MVICYWSLRLGKIIRALAIASGVVFSACAQPNGPDPVETEIPIERLRSEAFSFSTFSGFHEPERLLMRDASAWSRAWLTIHDRMQPQPPLPDIDFAKDIVVLVALGDRPSTGYHVIVKRASRLGEGITVSIESSSPGPGCGGLTVLTQPVDVAKMPRAVGPVVFVETKVVRDCR